MKAARKKEDASVTQDRANLGTDTAKEPSDRLFGCLVGALFLVLGAWPTLFLRPYRPTWLGAGAALAILALVFPTSLAWPKRFWIAITHRIGIVLNWVLTGTVFFLVLTPVAIVLRWRGRDALRLKRKPDAPTYWIPSARDTTMKQPF